MTSFNLYLTFEVEGHEPAQADEVVASVQAFLQAKALWADFYDAPYTGLFAMTLVGGGSLVHAGTHYPVLVSNPSRWPIEQEFHRWITEHFGATTRTRYATLDADACEPTERWMHYVESNLGLRVEAARGRYARRDVPEMVRWYPSLRAWEQRDALLNLLIDSADAVPEEYWRDLLRAPASLAECKLNSLVRLSGYELDWTELQRDLPRAERIARRILEEGVTVAEAVAREAAPAAERPQNSPREPGGA